MNRTTSGTALGVAIATAVLLVYGLFRPDSLEFSLPFLIAPALAMLWTVASREGGDRKAALAVTWAVVAGVIVVVFINWLRS